ncbi:hypothetical protein TSUD_293580 [Trifolium subterraneum]|uniref:Reverse transcriptase n=1 Tax=Trifolium subterraneum TaxID=3900 RepID=A0A2Z6N173_TRISU|nr:hypothetical protein TSUD_293580 [Trifolium subterraneum]
MEANHGTPSLQTAVEEIRSLQWKIATIEKEQAEQNVDSDDESLSPFVKHSRIPKFQTTSKHLRCKLLSGTFKDAVLRWYMNLPKNSIESYADFHKKFIHQFYGTKHIKVTATSLFTIRRNYVETLREYLARFSEATIKVSNPNQEMFVAAFYNGLKVGHFNESLAQKPATPMQEVIKRASCYIKGEESNAEKRSRDAKEKDMRSNNSKGQISQPQRNWKNNDIHKQGYRSKSYYPPNGSGGLAPFPPPRTNIIVMGPDIEAWCSYHRCKGHDTERCFRLRDLIEDLIRSGHLGKFLEDAAKRQIALPKQMPYPPKGEGDGGNKGEKHIVAVNTISGGFARGGESNSARMRYVRRSRFEICSVGNSTFPHTPKISFNAEDGRDITPHDDDPLVIQVQILNCDVKRVLIDSGSYIDILYWDAFKAMRLSYEQLNPYYGTLVGFAGEQVDGMGHITLHTTFGEGENAKTIKYTLNNGKIGVVKGDQALARKCYESSLKIRHKPTKPSSCPDNGKRANGINMVSITDMDPREEFQDRRLSPIEDLEQGVITHKLSISSTTKPIVQRKRKVGEERRAAITEEVAKLKEAGFIEEIKYPTWLIDGALGYKTLSFMDAYSRYNQIKMNPMDGQHTAFMSNTCNYFYNVMPFGLKNAGATYQRLMDRVFAGQIGKNLEVYIDDMIVKTEEEGEHDKDLADILKSIRKYNIRLNPANCSFGVQDGKFLGFLFTHRGIEANPDKCQAIINMRIPNSVKECEEAFQKLKVFLASPHILTRPEQGKTLYLYLAVSEKALSLAIGHEIEGEEKPIYFVSRTLRGAETRYQKFEKLSLVVVITARKLRQYFQSHQVVVKTDYPIKNVLRKPDLVGRMVAWSVELSEFDIMYVPRGAIESQALADFVLELTNPPSENEPQPWTLSVDDSSNLRGSGAGVVLEGPEGVLIEQSLRFAFKASNNQAEYEALIAGMKLAKEMEVQELKAQSDSQLEMAKYFTTFELTYVPREQNAGADLLAKLASTKKPGNHRIVIQETLKSPSVNELVVGMVVEEEDWRGPIIRFLQRDILPREKDEATKIRKMAAWYTMVGDKLYKRGFSTPMLLCVSHTEASRILNEIHEGSCGSHTGPRSMAGKVLLPHPRPKQGGSSWRLTTLKANTTSAPLFLEGRCLHIRGNILPLSSTPFLTDLDDMDLPLHWSSRRIFKRNGNIRDVALSELLILRSS